MSPDVLWSCTTCGPRTAVPGDIAHIDHIVDMRRYQVLMASEFPNELNSLFKNIEIKGNPWGMNASDRNAWIQEVDFPVRVFGMDGEDEIPADVEYLFWVGCAGAFEDRAKQTTKAVAELLHMAGVEFMVLGKGETCNGDPARRAGNEFLFQMQAMQNVEVLNEIKATKIVDVPALLEHPGGNTHSWAAITRSCTTRAAQLTRRRRQDYGRQARGSHRDLSRSVLSRSTQRRHHTTTRADR